jgi:hypothetical protein
MRLVKAIVLLSTVLQGVGGTTMAGAPALKNINSAHGKFC